MKKSGNGTKKGKPRGKSQANSSGKSPTRSNGLVYTKGSKNKDIEKYDLPPLASNTHLVDNRKLVDNGKRKTRNKNLAHALNIQLRQFATLIFIFTCSLLFLLAFSSTTLINNNIELLKKQVTELQDENKSLRIQIAGQIDLKYIESVATTKLLMAKPKAYQERYIIVPKSDHTLMFDDVPVIKNKKLFAFTFAKLFGNEENVLPNSPQNNLTTTD